MCVWEVNERGKKNNNEVSGIVSVGGYERTRHLLK